MQCAWRNRLPIAFLSRSRGSQSARWTQKREIHATERKDIIFRDSDSILAGKHVIELDNGAIESRRYLLRGDGFGFSMQHAIIRQNHVARLDYQNHVVAAMITRGQGQLRLIPSKATSSSSAHDTHALQEGSFFALHAAEVVEIEALTPELHLISVLNPPLVGTERKNEDGVFTMIDQDGVERDFYDHTLVRRVFEPPESLRGGSIMKDDPLF